MTREEALEVMWKNLPSDKSLPVYEALQTLIPELCPEFKAGDIVVDYKLIERKPAKLSVEDKQLVLKDISARVPYKVKFQNENIPTPNVLTLDMTYLRMFEIREGVIFKPYLRPRSSMTEAEKDEEFKMCSLNCSEWEMADFFNKHHLDYHGLIEKGLAIEAPEDMYKND